MTDDEVLDRLRSAFAMPRPARFTNHPGCSECAEHDETLQRHTHESLSYAEVGSAAWNPITMCQPDAFAYWLPALARICLEPEDAAWGWYGELLLTRDLRRDGPRNERWAFCTPGQRAAVVSFLHHLIESRSALLRQYDLEREVLDVVAIWSEGAEPGETKS